MTYNYADNHRHQFVHKHTHLLPDPEFPYRKTLLHRYHSIQPPSKCVPEAWHAEGEEPSQFDHSPQPPYQPDRYSRWEIPRKSETARVTEIHAKLDHLLAASYKLGNKWDVTNRRIRKLHTPPRHESAPDGGDHRGARQPWRDPPPTRNPIAGYRGCFHDQPRPRTIDNNWDQGEWHDRRDHRQRQGVEEYTGRCQQPRNGHTKQLHQPSCWDPPGYRCPPEVLHTQPMYQPPPNQPTDSLDWQQPYQPRRSYHPSGEPHQFDQSPSHHTTMLPAAARTRSGSVHLPQKSRKFMDSRQKRGLSNNPELMVRSLTPVQQAALDDYNEKLRIYRLEQAALLAHLNAWFEENIQDENLAEEKTPTIVCGDDVPNDITDFHNDGVSLDVPNNESLDEVPNDESLEEIVKPNDESLEEIVKTGNMPAQVLVGEYDEKIGDLIVPEHRELEIQDDIETFVEENVVWYKDIVVLITSLFDRNIGATQINSKSSRSHIMFTCIIESRCRSSLQSSIRYQQRLLKFDPGGEASVIDHLHCFVISLLRDFHLEDKADFNRGGVVTNLL